MINGREINLIGITKLKDKTPKGNKSKRKRDNEEDDNNQNRNKIKQQEKRSQTETKEIHKQNYRPIFNLAMCFAKNAELV